MEPYRISGVAARCIENEEEIIQSGKPYLDFRNKEHLY
jgi:hypothetical protein